VRTKLVARKNDKIKIQSRKEEGRTQGSRNLRRLASFVSSACSSAEKLFSEEVVPIRSSIFFRAPCKTLLFFSPGFFPDFYFYFENFYFYFVQNQGKVKDYEKYYFI